MQHFTTFLMLLLLGYVLYLGHDRKQKRAETMEVITLDQDTIDYPTHIMAIGEGAGADQVSGHHILIIGDSMSGPYPSNSVHIDPDFEIFQTEWGKQLLADIRQWQGLQATWRTTLQVNNLNMETLQDYIWKKYGDHITQYYHRKKMKA